MHLSRWSPPWNVLRSEAESWVHQKEVAQAIYNHIIYLYITVNIAVYRTCIYRKPYELLAQTALQFLYCLVIVIKS